MRSTKYPETPYFVPNGDNQEETATLLVGTAAEYGLPQRSVRATVGGFKVSEELADIVFSDGAGEVEAEVEAEVDEAGDTFDVSDYGVAEVKAFVTENPDEAEAVRSAEVEGKNRKSLIEWLDEFLTETDETSGDRAAKNNSTATDKE